MEKEQFVKNQTQVNPQQINQPVSESGQSESRGKFFPVLTISLFWIILVYFSTLLILGMMFESSRVVVDIFSLIRPGLFAVFFYGFMDAPQPLYILVLFDFLLIVLLVGLSVFSFFNQRFSKRLFSVIIALFLLLSALTLLTFLEECGGLGCIGQGLMLFFEVIGAFVAASLLPMLWLSRKELTSTKEIFIKGLLLGFLIFMVIIVLAVLSAGGKKKTDLLEPTYLPSNITRRTMFSSDYGVTVWSQYYCNEPFSFNLRQTPKKYMSISVSEGKLSTRIQSGETAPIGTTPRYITDELVINGNKGYYIEIEFEFGGEKSGGDIRSQMLIWESAESVLVIETFSPCILPKEELVKIAESMR